jgi:S-adenosylmethionine hydrolase
VHLAIVDPGVGTEREILLVACDGHVFVAPDNGLLAQLIDRCAAPQVYKLSLDKLGSLDLPAPSATFHGRDIFAPVAAELAAGRLSIDDLAVPTTDWTPGWVDDPDTSGGKVTGIVVTVDTFGNLISNIDIALIADFKEPVADIAGHQIAMQLTYGCARPGDYLALINSFGVVEIARAEGSAADGLGSERGAPLVIRDGYKT